MRYSERTFMSSAHARYRVIVDTMPKWGGERPEGAPSIDTPAFMLLVKHVGRCEFKEETKM